MNKILITTFLLLGLYGCRKSNTAQPQGDTFFKVYQNVPLANQYETYLVTSVLSDDAGNIYVNFNGGQYGFSTMKTDKNGNVIWIKPNPAVNIWYQYYKPIFSGKYLYTFGYDTLFIQDTGCNLISKIFINDPDFDMNVLTTSIIQSADNNFAIVGSGPYTDGGKLFFYKVSLDGTILLKKTFDSIPTYAYDYFSILETGSHDFIAAVIPSDSINAFLIYKLSAGGDVVWKKNFLLAKDFCYYSSFFFNGNYGINFRGIGIFGTNGGYSLALQKYYTAGIYNLVGTSGAIASSIQVYSLDTTGNLTDSLELQYGNQLYLYAAAQKPDGNMVMGAASLLKHNVPYNSAIYETGTDCRLVRQKTLSQGPQSIHISDMTLTQDGKIISAGSFTDPSSQPKIFIAKMNNNEDY